MEHYLEAISARRNRGEKRREIITKSREAVLYIAYVSISTLINENRSGRIKENLSPLKTDCTTFRADHPRRESTRIRGIADRVVIAHQMFGLANTGMPYPRSPPSHAAERAPSPLSRSREIDEIRCSDLSRARDRRKGTFSPGVEINGTRREGGGGRGRAARAFLSVVFTYARVGGYTLHSRHARAR